MEAWTELIFILMITDYKEQAVVTVYSFYYSSLLDDSKKDPSISVDPYKTLFVGRLR